MADYSVEAVLSAVDKNFTSSMKAAAKTLDGVSESANKNAKSVRSTFDKLGGDINRVLSKGIAVGAKAMAVAGTASMAAAGATLIKSMNLAGELEQNLGGSEAVFEQYASNIQKIGEDAYKKMGLSQSDFLATANKMGSLYQGVGFSVKDSMSMSSEAMQRAADVASIMGIDMGSAMESVAGMAKGNYTMMDNLGVAMNDTTIGNYALAKGIDKSTQEMTTQEKVGLATQMFLEKTAKYAGNYAKENDTLSGSLQTAKGALSNFMSGAGDVDAVVDAWMNFAGVAGKMAKELAPKLFAGISKAVQEIIPKIPSMLSSLAENIASVLADMFGDGARDAFGVLYDAIVVSIDGLKSAFDFIVKYKDIFAPIAVGIASIVGFLSAWNAITKVATAIQTAFNVVLNANPIGLIILAVVGLVSALVYFFTQTKTGQKLWKSFTDWLAETWNNLVAIATTVFNTLSEFFTGLWNGIVSVATSLWSTFGSSITGIWNGIVSIAKGVWELLKAVILGPVLIVIDLVTGNFDKLGSDLAAIWNSIKSAVQSIWNGIKSYFSGVISGIVAYVTSTFNAMKSTLSSIMNSVRSVISNAWQAIKNTATSLVSGLVNSVKNLFNGLSNINLLDIGKAIMTSLFDGLKSAWSKVTDFVGGIGDWIREHKGPIRVDKKLLIPAGNAIMQGLDEGLQDKFRSVQRTVSGMSDKIYDAMYANGSQFSFGMASQFSSSMSYSNEDAGQPIVVQSVLDGKVIAESTATMMSKILDKQSDNTSYNNGVRRVR